jgi:uncharacterized protein YjbJ (UPF0337 family)
MNKDRVAGSAKEIKGAVKQVVGKAAGDAKLQSEGKADKVEGKVQNAIGTSKTRSRKNRRNGHGLLPLRSRTPSRSTHHRQFRRG